MERRFINGRVQDTLMKANGLCVIFIRAAGALQKMLYIDNGSIGIQGTMKLIGFFALGPLIGELLKLELLMEKFGIWLCEKTGNSEDAGFLKWMFNSFLYGMYRCHGDCRSF